MSILSSVDVYLFFLQNSLSSHGMRYAIFAACLRRIMQVFPRWWSIVHIEYLKKMPEYDFHFKLNLNPLKRSLMMIHFMEAPSFASASVMEVLYDNHWATMELSNIIKVFDPERSLGWHWPFAGRDWFHLLRREPWLCIKTVELVHAASASNRIRFKELTVTCRHPDLAQENYNFIYRDIKPNHDSRHTLRDGSTPGPRGVRAEVWMPPFQEKLPSERIDGDDPELVKLVKPKQQLRDKYVQDPDEIYDTDTSEW